MYTWPISSLNPSQNIFSLIKLKFLETISRKKVKFNIHIWNWVKKLAKEVALKKFHFARASIFIHILRVYSPLCLLDIFYLCSFDWKHYGTVSSENMLFTAAVITGYSFKVSLLSSANSFWNLRIWKRYLKFYFANELFSDGMWIGLLLCGWNSNHGVNVEWFNIRDYRMAGSLLGDIYFVTFVTFKL